MEVGAVTVKGLGERLGILAEVKWSRGGATDDFNVQY